VGFLRDRGIYRAPCRWYPGGPIGEIEYYWAAPGAQWYDGPQAFFPLNFFKGVKNEGVGELTEEGPRQFNLRNLAPPAPGVSHVGRPADFAGETPYPGESTPEQLPNCGSPTLPVESIGPVTFDEVKVVIENVELFKGGVTYRLAGEETAIQQLAGGFYSTNPIKWTATLGPDIATRLDGWSVVLERQVYSNSLSDFLIVQLTFTLAGDRYLPFDVSVVPSVATQESTSDGGFVSRPERLVSTPRIRLIPLWRPV
jgi:hypothetical protein